jgi:beta-glucuronidase
MVRRRLPNIEVMTAPIRLAACLRSCGFVARSAVTVLTALVLALMAAGPAMAQGKPWYTDGPGGRVLLDGAWLYRGDPHNEGLTAGWAADPDTTGWSPTTIPNAWNADDDSAASMRGSVGWYRRDFEVPPQPANAEWIVRFESVNYRATVFLNGVQIGQHEAASIPFEIPLTALEPGVNRLVVRVDSRRDRTSLPPGPNGGWWNYGGILREVYLRPVNELDISELLTRTVSRDTLLVRATLSNPGGGTRRANVVFRVAGKKVRLGSVRIASGTTRTVGRQVRIPHARLWAPRAPALYEVDATAWVKNKAVATYVVHTGLRSVGVRRDGRMTINGFPVNLRGAALHEQTVAHGAALTPRDHAMQIANLLDLHADFTRAHYPLSEDFLERADRAGIAVWEEIPFWQVPEATMRNPAFRQKALAYLATTIKRDQNHPSVIAWSIGNELPSAPEWGQATYLRQAAALVHRLDPTRPVALALADVPGANQQPAYAPIQVLGINDYFGWFAGDAGATQNQAALGQYLDRLHADYPRKALFITEFGAEATRSGPATEKGTYAYQQNFMRYHLATYAARPWINGALWWILQDFKVRPGWTGGNPQPDPPWVHKGLLDPNGTRRPAYTLTQQSFAQTPPLLRPGDF